MIKNDALYTEQIRRETIKLIAPLKKHQPVFPDSPKTNDAAVNVGKSEREVLAICLCFICCSKVTALERLNNLHCILYRMN